MYKYFKMSSPIRHLIGTVWSESTLLAQSCVSEHFWGRSGSLEEYLTRDRGAAGSSLTGVTALFS